MKKRFVSFFVGSGNGASVCYYRLCYSRYG